MIAKKDHNELNLSTYKELVSQRLKNYNVEHRKFCDLDKYPIILGKECIYVMDWKKKSITYQRGVPEMLGYSEDEFRMDLALNYFHPEDRNFVDRIIRGIVNHSIENKVNQDDHFLNLSFRLRKKDGTYLKVIRKSYYYEVDSHGRLVSNFSGLIDIDFISNNNKVEWDLFMSNIDREGFKRNVHREFHNFFTKKENEIIRQPKSGMTTVEIANRLFVSPNTVATHRKNILRKSRCHNLRELLEFCEKNGIL